MVQKIPKSRINKILQIVRRTYPDVKTALRHQNPLEMLIATILSAQCTDVRVNEVTKTLFKKLRTAKDYADIPLAELEEMIRPTGFFETRPRVLRGAVEGL